MKFVFTRKNPDASAHCTEILKNTSGTYVSSSDDDCEPYSCDLELRHLKQCKTDSQWNIITFPEFRYEEISFDPDAGQLSITGKANILEPTVVAGSS